MYVCMCVCICVHIHIYIYRNIYVRYLNVSLQTYLFIYILYACMPMYGKLFISLPGSI